MIKCWLRLLRKGCEKRERKVWLTKDQPPMIAMLKLTRVEHEERGSQIQIPMIQVISSDVLCQRFHSFKKFM